MTREEAINEIEMQSKAGVKAFQVISLDETDIKSYGDSDLNGRFDALSDEAKARYMSALIDAMYDTLEQDEFYGFKKLMRDTLEAISLDGEYIEMFKDAEGR